MSQLPPSTPLPPPSQPPKGALRTILLIVFLDLMGFGIIIPLLPFYARQFQASPFEVTALFSLYSICQFLASPILGALSDRHGRRPILTLSQIGSALGFVLLGVVTLRHWENATLGLWLVYLSRIIDGISGGNISTAQAYISDVTTVENRSKAMGLLGAAFGVGFAAGPAIGGFLGHWHVSYPAFAAALFAAVASLMTYRYLPESIVHRTASTERWLHPQSFQPVLRSPALVQLLLISFVCMAAFVMMEASIAMFLNDRFGYGPAQVGWYFAFLGGFIIVVQGGLIGRLSNAFGDWPLAIVGPALVAVGMICLVQAGYHPLLSVLLLGGAFSAIGRSLWQPTVSSLVSKYSDPRHHGAVFGLFHGLGGIARVIGPVVAGLVYEPRVAIGPFLVAAVALLAAALWTAGLRSRHPKPVLIQPMGFEPILKTP